MNVKATIDNFKERLKPELSEKEAATLMISKIKSSFLSHRTRMYDRYQYWEGGIPYY